MKVSFFVSNPNGPFDNYEKELVEGVDYEDVDDISYTITALNSANSGTQLSFTEEVTFLGEVVDIIKQVFVLNNLSLDTYIKITVIDDCCGVDIVLADAVVTKEDFKFCLSEGDKICKVTTDVRAADASARDYVCIRSALINKSDIIWPDGKEFRFLDHPSVPYCNQLRPAVVKVFLQFLAGLSMLSFFVFLPLLFLVEIILEAINAIIDIVGGNKIDLDSSLSGNQTIFELAQRLIANELPQLVTGCGFNHVAPFVRSYIQNVCLQCGDLQFSSTILNDLSSVYYNMVMLGPGFRKGNRPLYDGGSLNLTVMARYWKYNTPNITGGELLDRLAKLFNAQWWVQDGILYFEQEGLNVEPILRSYDANLEVDSICFESDEDRVYSGVALVYEQDGVDVVGDEARYLYNDIIPFYDSSDRNPTVKRKLREEKFLFGTSRFVGDHIDSEDDWAIEKSVAAFFNAVLSFSTFLIGFNYKAPKDGTLLLEKDVCSLPKLLILKNNYNKEAALVIEDGGYYNHYLWFSAKAYGGLWANSDPPNSSKVIKEPNLWQYWQNEDTRISASPLNAYTVTIELAKSCVWYKDFMLAVTSDISKKYYIEHLIEGRYYLSTFDSIQISGSKVVVKSTLI